MDNLPINSLDLIVIAVLVVSGAFAFFRGFVHEVLAIAGWLGAAFIAIYAMPWTGPMAREYIEAGWLADAAAGGAVFLVMLLVLSLLTHALSRRIRDSALNSLDRSLGFIFGVARGALLVTLAYMLGVWLLSPDEQPEWLAQAKTRPMMETGVRVVQAVLPEHIASVKTEAQKAADKARELQEVEKIYRELREPKPLSEHSDQADDGGYAPDERREMDRLFQSNQ